MHIFNTIYVIKIFNLFVFAINFFTLISKKEICLILCLLSYNIIQ